MSKTKLPVKKTHVITTAIALVVVVVFLWTINNVTVASDAAIQAGIKG